MKKNNLTAIVIIALIVISAVFLYAAKISYSNDEVKLRIRAKKQEDVCRIVYDDMWKIIKKKAQIPEKYKDDFKEVILTDNQAYGKDGIKLGGAFNTIQKINPKFTPEMYQELMMTIESETKRFEREQKTLISISEEHEVLISTFPGNFFLSVQPLNIKLVTSSKTKDVFESGEDNDTDIFNSKKDTIK
jgi:hypothetical protein